MNKKLTTTLNLPLSLILASSFAFSSSAFSANLKAKKKKQTVGQLLKKIKEDSRGAKIKELSKGNTNLPESQLGFESRQNVNLARVKPPKSSEIFKHENSDQAAYEKTLDLQIQELYKLTQRFKNNDNRGELWLRLAELYVEKSSLVDARKQDTFDLKLKEFQAGKTKVKPKLDLGEARDYNKKAIQLYEWFLKDYPRDAKVSQALFFLGYNYFEIGDNKQGAHYYDRLTKEFPKSPYVGEAHFALGEFYFENEKWADAYKEYTKLIKDRRHRLNTFALYKGAWCLYRLGKTEEGIKYLDYIIKGAKNEASGELVAGKKLNTSKLENEALRDLVVFFAELGDTKRAVAYFRAINSKEANANIEKLAYYLSDKGNREGAKEVFRMLIAQDPTSKKAFEYQYQIVQNYFYAKNSPQFKEELYHWITDFDQKSQWYAANRGDDAFLKNSYKLREQTLRNYILQQHQTAQNSRAVYSRQTASEGYKLYFQEFQDSAQVADMHFFHGELLYDMGKYGEASTEYAWVAENAESSKFAAKASQNLLLSIEKALPRDEELQKRVGDSVEPIPMDPRVEKFIKSATWYTQKYPTSDKDAEIKFRMGRLYYQTNNFGPAEKLFKEIVKKHPKTKYSEYSANLLLDIYNLKKDYAGLEKMGTELLADDSFAASKAGSDVRGVLEKANFKKAQDLETSKKYLDAAKQYQTFAVQNPKSDLAVVALFNAGVNFERSGRNLDAIQNYRKVVASNDKAAANLKPKSQKLLAKLYQDSGLFEESAVLFKQLAKDNPKDPLMPNYLFNSAVMYEALGKNSEAMGSYNEFISVNKNQSENAAALFTLAQLQRKSNALTGAINHYKEYVELPQAKLDKKVEAQHWIAEISQKLGRRKDNEEAKVAILALHRRLPADKKNLANSYVAQIKLEQAQESFKEMKRITIPANPAKQKQAVDKKLEGIDKLNKELAEIIKLDSAEEIVTALTMGAEANDHLAAAIQATPYPPNLNEEQKKQYKAGIDRITNPFSQKAEDSYKLAVERAWDLEVYNAAYKTSLAQMNKRNPKLYYNNGEVGADSRFVNWMGDK
ncbi:MAG: tetratricopeptide repeat protein [Bdellovibrionaceae bacterium]|nr:tetratricopeptide repeat protein [Bdellovibrio sp.]